MATISISELHAQTSLWLQKATEGEPVIVTEQGKLIAKIVACSEDDCDNPFLRRKLLPGFAELQARLSGGSESTTVISRMRDEE